MTINEAIIKRINSWINEAKRELSRSDMSDMDPSYYYGFINALRNVLKLIKD